MSHAVSSCLRKEKSFSVVSSKFFSCEYRNIGESTWPNDPKQLCCEKQKSPWKILRFVEECLGQSHCRDSSWDQWHTIHHSPTSPFITLLCTLLWTTPDLGNRENGKTSKEPGELGLAQLRLCSAGRDASHCPCTKSLFMALNQSQSFSTDSGLSFPQRKSWQN